LPGTRPGIAAVVTKYRKADPNEKYIIGYENRLPDLSAGIWNHIFLSKGNFNLHSVYLNGLMAVSPGVKNYGRVAEIISIQASLVSEYKRNYKQFRQSGSFSISELNYMGDVYNKLVAETLDNIMKS
jgi:hypothetical protein